MATTLFIPPFITAFGLTVVFTLFILVLPLLSKKRYRGRERRKKNRNISRFGGVAMLVAYLLSMLFDPHLVLTREMIGLSAGIGLVFAFGFWDDVQELSWKVQIFFQVALGVVIFLFGMRIASITSPFGGAFTFPIEGFVIPSFLILLGWLFLVMNSMNWLDGMDGLSGGVALITFVTIFFLSLKPEVNQPPIAILCAIGAGVTLGFLLFNVPPAKILAGTTGSMFLGFTIAVLAIIAGTKIATALLVLALPIADALWVIVQRLRAHTSIFEPDQRHLHYRLSELGWSETRIAWFFSFVTAVIALIALSTEALGKFVALLLVLLVIFSLLLFVERKTRIKYMLEHPS